MRACDSSAQEWYVFIIKQLFKDVEPGEVKRRSPITLISSCAGSFAEASALKAGRLVFWELEFSI